MEGVGPFLHMAGSELTQCGFASSVHVEVQLLVGVQISCVRHYLSYSVLAMDTQGTPLDVYPLDALDVPLLDIYPTGCPG